MYCNIRINYFCYGNHRGSYFHNPLFFFNPFQYPSGLFESHFLNRHKEVGVVNTFAQVFKIEQATSQKCYIIPCSLSTPLQWSSCLMG